MSISRPASSRWSRAGRRVGVADLAQRRVLVGGARVGRVGQRGQRLRRARPRRRRAPRPAPSPGARPPASRRSPRSRPRRPSWRARSPCEASFWRARSASTSGSSSSRRASSCRARVQARVGAVAAARERGPHRLGVAADRLQVEHRLAGERAGTGPEYLRDERRDLLRVLARDDVLRHRARREAAVLDGVEHVLLALLALVEVRAVLVLAGLDLARRALGARRGERVAARAVLDEELRALVVRVGLGQLDVRRCRSPSGRARRGTSRSAASRRGGRMSGAQHTEQSPGPMPSLRHITALALAVAAALPAAGCADDAAHPARVRDGRVTVTLDDFSITPAADPRQAGPDHLPRGQPRRDRAHPARDARRARGGGDQDAAPGRLRRRASGTFERGTTSSSASSATTRSWACTAP